MRLTDDLLHWCLSRWIYNLHLPGKKQHGEEAFVVVELTVRVWWFPSGYLLAIQGPKGMMNIPPVLELLGNGLPLLLGPWKWHDFIFQHLYTSLTEFLHSEYHCAVATSKIIPEGVIPVSYIKVSEGHGQVRLQGHLSYGCSSSGWLG